MDHDNVLLVLVVPAGAREELVDLLMEQGALSGFSLATIDGYSAEHSAFDVREQVSGYRAFCRFEILLEREEVDKALALLRPACQRRGGRYWVMPLIDAGRFADD